MKDLAASLRQRLLNYSREHQVDANLIFARFAAERLLYRLAQSPYVDRFVLKGALLLLVWFAETVRPTRDVDLPSRSSKIANTYGKKPSAVSIVCHRPWRVPGPTRLFFS